jgi:hypothetical protein
MDFAATMERRRGAPPPAAFSSFKATHRVMVTAPKALGQRAKPRKEGVGANRDNLVVPLLGVAARKDAGDAKKTEETLSMWHSERPSF